VFTRTRGVAALLLAVGLVACGNSSPDAATPKTPKRIVSMSASVTESLFAIGAGKQVIAADNYSNYPKGAPTTKLSAYDPSAEAIAKYKPDLVILSNDTKNVVKGLKTLKIPVLLQPAPANIATVYTQITELGRRTGHVTEAAKTVDRIKADVAEIVGTADVAGLSYFYELDSTLYSQTSQTFLGRLLGKLGLVNIADAAQATSPYPQLSAEYVINTNPDLVILADTKCCGQSKATVAARPGWATMKAVHGDGVVPLDDDIASRWGPRIVGLLRLVATAAAKVKSAP
jgi:ABC-type Fe3+-hydroxamate transport system substrate-binding protein